ncbi:MAG: response regulator [Nitrospirae bacterium]|nr:MAG: response regulator [Nitrospirota bacterium]
MKVQTDRHPNIKEQTEVFALDFLRHSPCSEQLKGGRVASRRPKRILVVDDDPDIRQVLLDRMSSFGYLVETAIDGREALDVLRREGFDGMLLDMLMPGLNGLEVLRRTRESHPDMPVVVVTALSVRQHAAQAVAEGAQAYLLKPFDASQLKQVVKQCFGSAV